MMVHGVEVDNERGFVLTCGKLEPIEFHCASAEEGYQRARERQRLERIKSRRIYTLTYWLKGETK